MTRDEELDRAFSKQEMIQPSSGFVSSVMDAVRADQSTPPPIAFPWKRALPGIVTAATTMVAVLAAWFGVLVLGRADSTTSAVVLHWLDRAFQLGLLWIALALVVTWGCVKVSMRIAQARL